MRCSFKYIFLAAAAVVCLATSAQAALIAGDIVITGFNADGLDDISFAALKPIPIGTTIGFTDNEWNGTTWIDNNENGFTWTATSAVPVGSIVHLTNLTNLTSGSPTAAATFGTLGAIAAAGTNRGIGNSDEALWAFVGAYASPTSFLTVMGNDTLANTGNVLTNTGLTAGNTAFFFPGDEDIMAYTGLRNNKTLADGGFPAYRPQVYNVANWISQDAGGDQSIDGTAPDVPFSSTPFTIPEPSSVVLTLFGLLIAGVVRSRR